jgi:S1-C subfamily serine protease
MYARRGRRLAATLSIFSALCLPPAMGCLTGCESVAHGGVREPITSAASSASSSDISAESTLDVTGLQSRFAAVADSVSRSVVAISASCTPVNGDEVLRTENLNPQRLNAILSKTTRTVGTGFFIDAEGFILTNEHVICEAEQLWVTTDDRHVYPAMIIATDPRSDLAVLKIPASGVEPVKFARPDRAIHRGIWTIAIGNPYGLASEGELAMSVGVVSATERSLPKLSSKENRLYADLIQTTAEINPGNSGGPLFDIAGEVIGINTAVILPQKQTNGIGFAIPITRRLLDEVEQLKSGSDAVYAFMGISVTDPTLKELREAGITGSGSGVRVEGIDSDSPASRSILKKNDIILNINGQVIRDSDDFVRIVGAAPIDRPARLRIRRDGRAIEASVTPARRPVTQVALRESQRLRWHGMMLGPVPSNWAGNGVSAPAGVYVLGVENAESCAKLGIKQGSIITTVAGKVVKSLADLQKVIDATPPDAIKFETAESATVVSAQQ